MQCNSIQQTKKSFLYQILKQAKQLVSKIRILVYFSGEEGNDF